MSVERDFNERTTNFQAQMNDSRTSRIRGVRNSSLPEPVANALKPSLSLARPYISLSQPRLLFSTETTHHFLTSGPAHSPSQANESRRVEAQGQAPTSPSLVSTRPESRPFLQATSKQNRVQSVHAACTSYACSRLLTCYWLGGGWRRRQGLAAGTAAGLAGQLGLRGTGF